MRSSDELQFAYEIKQKLNKGAAQLPAATEERLRAARERALAHQRQAVGKLVTAGVPGSGGFGFGWLGQLAPLVLLVGGLFAINYWHQTQQTLDIADVDTQMLVDELPPNAYLDKGFGAWLTRQGQ